MNQRELAAIPEPMGLTDVRSEQIRILFAATPLSLMSILICSLVVGAVQWSVIDHSTILIWLASTNLLSLVRLIMYLRFKRNERERVVSPGWYTWAIVTSIASGLTWGIGGFLLFAEQSPVHQVFLGFVIAGICAGAITTLSAVIEAARGFVIAAILPILIQFNLIDNEISVAMVGVSILFIFMVLVSAKRINQTIVESLEIRHQHELAEETIRHQAHFDELTNLPNRRALLATVIHCPLSEYASACAIPGAAATAPGTSAVGVVSSLSTASLGSGPPRKPGIRCWLAARPHPG